MNQLVSFINQSLDIRGSEKDLLEQLFEEIQLQAKTTFITEGRVEPFLYFIAEGIVRGYKNENGNIVVEHLAGQNSFVTSFDSFFSRRPGIDNFESLTDCIVYRTSFEGYTKLKGLGEKWRDFIESINHENMQCKLGRINDFQTLTAKQRYLKFLETNPELALNVSVENIASFLGMQPQSLSRIRSQIAM